MLCHLSSHATHSLKSTRRLVSYIRLSLVFSMTLSLICVLTGCGVNDDLPASVSVYHDVDNVANLEIFLDDNFKVDVEPKEISRIFNTSLGAHTLTVRSSGSPEVLLEMPLANLTERTNLLVLRGSAEQIELIEVSRRLPQVAQDEHKLEVINLAKSDLSFELYSGSDRILTIPFESMNSSALISDFITLSPEPNVRFSTNHKPLSDKPFEDINLAGGESSLLLILSRPQGESGLFELELLSMKTSTL